MAWIRQFGKQELSLTSGATRRVARKVPYVSPRIGDRNEIISRPNLQDSITISWVSYSTILVLEHATRCGDEFGFGVLDIPHIEVYYCDARSVVFHLLLNHPISPAKPIVG